MFVLLIFCVSFCRPKSDIITCTKTTKKIKKVNTSFEKTMRRPYAIFTSAGDNTNFHSVWGCEDSERAYDVWVVYYGDNDDRFNLYSKYADYIERRKGSKFQNFYHVYQQHKKVLLQYEYIFIADDDIIIAPENIELMFETAKEYDLWICQPSFRKGSKVSWGITRNRPHLKLAYTNFVEVNTPVISTSKLQECMNKYDPILLGWGIDFLLINALGIHEKKRYAILHNVSCINPYQSSKKGGKRELNLLPGCNERRYIWEAFAKKHGISSFKPTVHSSIKKLK